MHSEMLGTDNMCITVQQKIQMIAQCIRLDYTILSSIYGMQCVAYKK